MIEISGCSLNQASPEVFARWYNDLLYRGLDIDRERSGSFRAFSKFNTGFSGTNAGNKQAEEIDKPQDFVWSYPAGMGHIPKLTDLKDKIISVMCAGK